MARSNKQPKQKIYPNPTKVPIGEPPPFQTLKVEWCFSGFDKQVWHDEKHKRESFLEIAQHMRSYQSMTWKQIMQRRDYNHPVKKDRLTKEAQQRLETIKQEDIDELWRFRFTGKQRLWGIRDRNIFKILWWDPQHKVCPAAKKHT